MTVSPARDAAVLRRNQRLVAILQAASPALAARVGMALFLHPARKPVDEADRPTLSRARCSTLRDGRSQLAVYQWGDGSRHAVLVHGWGSGASRLAPMVETLLAEGWRVTAFDAPAHGRSSGWQSSLPAFEQSLLAVLASHGPAHLLGGHSLGALAIALALGEQRIAPMPDAAVLVGMPSGVPFLIERYQQMFPAGPAMTARFMQLFRRRFGNAPEHFIVQRVAASLQLPLLLVHDENDVVVPCAHSVALAPLLARAHLHLTQGFGHSALLRDAPTLARIAAFARETCRV